MIDHLSIIYHDYNNNIDFLLNTGQQSSDLDDYNYSLVGCTVSPGFDFSDFELASRAQCLQQYPSAANADIIIKLTEGLP